MEEGTHDEDKRSAIMDRDDILWKAYRGGACLGMVSLVAVVIEPGHSGEESLHMLQGCLPCEEEFTSRMSDDLGRWLPGWYVVEDDNDFRWRRM